MAAFLERALLDVSIVPLPAAQAARLARTCNLRRSRRASALRIATAAASRRTASVCSMAMLLARSITAARLGLRVTECTANFPLTAASVRSRSAYLPLLPICLHCHFRWSGVRDVPATEGATNARMSLKSTRIAFQSFRSECPRRKESAAIAAGNAHNSPALQLGGHVAPLETRVSLEGGLSGALVPASRDAAGRVPSPVGPRG